MNEFLQRLKERKLGQWTVAYVAAAFAHFKMNPHNFFAKLEDYHFHDARP
jgi:hypothetical protein